MFTKTYEHEKLKIRVLKCDYEKYNNTVQVTYYRYSNGVDFITPFGLVFVAEGNYEVLE